ncbi:MAG: ABC transporter substrate-binding protein [Desulfobacteraceae bacterium]
MRRILFFLIFFSCFSADPVISDDSKTIFLVHSYQKNYGCGPLIEKGMDGYLGNNSDKKINYIYYYMDSMGSELDEKFYSEKRDDILKKIENSNPDLVVLFDDVACKIMIPVLVNSKYKVLFGGMDLPPEKYNEKFHFMNSRQKPGFNITGVTEEVDFTKALGVLKEIIPDKKNMVIISSSSMDFIPEVLENLKENMNEKNLEYPFKLLGTVYVNNFTELKNQVIRYENDKNTDVIFVFAAMALEDENGRIVSVKEAVKWLVKNQLKPGLSWMNHWIELGHLCGACVDLTKCGIQMGKIAERILNGENPGDIPIEKPETHFIALNLERAEILNLKFPVHVLEGAEIVYEKAMSLY